MTSRQLYDEIRQKWVAATPEEIVRQSLVHMMIHELGYPKSLITLEKELSELPHLKARSASLPQRRLDILCFTPRGERLAPLLLIECKERALTEAARNQVIGYNHYVQASFIGVASQQGVEIGHFDSTTHNYLFYSLVPSYLDMISYL